MIIFKQCQRPIHSFRFQTFFCRISVKRSQYPIVITSILGHPVKISHLTILAGSTRNLVLFKESLDSKPHGNEFKSYLDKASLTDSKWCDYKISLMVVRLISTLQYCGKKNRLSCQQDNMTRSRVVSRCHPFGTKNPNFLSVRLCWGSDFNRASIVG